MNKPNSIMPLCALALLAAQMFTPAFEARAADFTVSDAKTETNGTTAATTLSATTITPVNSNDRLTVTATGSITISTSTPPLSGGSSPASTDGVRVTAAATNTTVINNGSITTSKLGSAGIRGASSGSITNNNNITTTLANSPGIIAVNGNTIINNDDGNINTSLSPGIQVGNNNRITNRGVITAANPGAANGAITVGTGNILSNSGRITATTGKGIGGAATSSITTLINTRNPAGVTGSGTIRGSTDGINVGFIGSLTNNEGAIIRGIAGEGVTLSRTTAGSGSVINHGTIQGATRGLNYGAHTISRLTNSGAILGGTGEALKATAITLLDNNSGGRIVSTSSEGISSTGVIGALTNSGTVSGGTYGVNAASIGTLTNNSTGLIQGGTLGTATDANSAAVRLSAAGASIISNSGRIIATKGEGIRGIATSIITSLSNTVSPGVAGSGTIEGNTDGINVGRIASLTNTGTIEGKGTTGSGIILSGAAPGLTVDTSVNNSGTIKGGQHGMSYGNNVITSLTNSGLIEGARGTGILHSSAARTNRPVNITNSGTIKGAVGGINYSVNTITSLTNSGTIQGGTGAALTAGPITQLNNQAGGKIISTGPNADGINNITGSIGTLTNDGEISGGRHGVNTGAISTLLTNNNTIKGGAAGNGLNVIGAIARLDNNRGAEISGGLHGVNAGSMAILENDGLIEGKGAAGAGINLAAGAGNATVTNSGTIKGGAQGLNYVGKTITRLENNTSRSRIEGGTGHAINAANIEELKNEGNITSTDAAGINLTAGAGNATVINSGTIKGGTQGLNYVGKTITDLQNNGSSSLIEGGAGHGVNAANINDLSNQGTIEGKGATGAGVNLTAGTGNGTVTNSGKIKGGAQGLNYVGKTITNLQNNGSSSLIEGGAGHGVNAANINDLSNQGTIEGKGTTGAGVNLTAGTGNGTVTNSGKIKGGAQGLNYTGKIITRLENNTSRSRIEGGTGHAINAARLDELKNEGNITSTSAAGINLTTGAGDATVTNSGTIKGDTLGLNYNGKTITRLENNGSGSRIEGGSGHAINAARLSVLENQGNIISTSAAGINLTATTPATTAVTVNNSGTIRGNTDGMNYGSNVITTLSNSGMIRGITGAGITMSGTATGRITVTNSGTIQGNTLGLNYGTNTIASLTNDGTIQGGNGAALTAGAITRLSNNAGSSIISATGAGINSTGAISNLSNSGEISGGGTNHGISAASVGTLVNNAGGTIKATGTGNGINSTGAITSLSNSGEILGGNNGSAVRAGSIGTLINNAGGKITATGTTSNGINSTNAITSLTNSGDISGGDSGVRAGSIGTLNNNAGGKITATQTTGSGINSTGAITSLSNSGDISGGRHGVRAGSIGTLANNAGGKITATQNTGSGISSANIINSLTNSAGGEISGGQHGISAASITALSNSGAIEGTAGAGITLDNAPGSVTVTNTSTGSIKGDTYGMNYDAKTITSLNNSGEIRGGSQAALRAAAITLLNNNAGGTIASTGNHGVSSRGNIGQLNNSGDISGGGAGHGVSALSINRLINNSGAGISGRQGVNATSITTLNNSGTIEGTAGAGITLLGPAPGRVTVTNTSTGIIKGTTYGMNYNGKTITNLNNSGEIQGGTAAALRAAAINLLNNNSGGTIKSTSSHGISSTGAIGELTNSGEISGGGAGHGISAASITTSLTNNRTIRGGTTGSGLNVSGEIARLTNNSGAEISGGQNGINAGSLISLINNGRITSNNGGGITLNSTASGAATVTNTNTILGATHGMDYGNNVISRLTNTSTGLIQGGTGAALAAGNINRLQNDDGGRITSTDGDGIRSTGAIRTLINNGSITSTNASGITSTGAGTGNITITNNNTISGGTYGINYGNNKTITRLENSSTGLIQGGSNAAVAARDITDLNNRIRGRIISTNNDGIRTTGAIDDLDNKGTISGGLDGVSATSVNTLINANTGVIRGGTASGATDDNAAVKLRGAGSNITNRGRIIAQRGDGIGGTATASINSLINEAADNTVAGSGVISGADAGVSVGRSIATLTNRGTISGGRDGVRAASVNALTNASTGVISSGTADRATAENAAVRLSGTGSNITNRGRITAQRGDGIGGTPASSITSLSNQVSSGVTGSGAITGANNGIRVGSIGSLSNNAGARIEGTAGAGIKLLGTAAGAVNVTNRGTIKGATQGMDYLANTITKLENTGTGRIEGGSGEGVKTTGAITELDNDGEISGGTDGVSAASVGLDNSGTITGGTSANTATANNAAVRLSGTGSNISNRGRITAQRGDGIGGIAASSITRLNNQVSSGVTGSGVILGANNGIRVGAIGSLSNNVGATIRGTSGAGISLTGSGVGGAGTVSNSGTIQGATEGMDYGRNTITRLTNTRTGLIQGGTGAALAGSDITRLDNNAGGRILSTSNDGIRSSGTIGTLNNDGAISGGRHGAGAAAIGTLTNNKTITGGRGGSGLNVSGEVTTLTNTKEAQISGGQNGIRAGSLITLTNAGRIISASGGGITLTGTASGAATVMNTGTIQGATHGMDYGNNGIASLTNISVNSIRGGTDDALRAATLLRLNNRGTIASKSAGGITLTGTASGAEFTNSGTIEGRTHGINYGNNAIARFDNTGVVRGVTSAAIMGGPLGRLNNSGTIEGRTGIRIRRPAVAAGAPVRGGATIDHSGLLTGTGGTALELRGRGRDTLLLREGNRLEGLISWDGEDGDRFHYMPRGPGIFSFLDNNAPAGSAPSRFTIVAPGQQTILTSASPSSTPGEARVTVAFLDSNLYALTDNTFSRWTGSVSEALVQQTRSEGPDSTGKNIWLRPFAGFQRFKSEGLRPAVRHNYKGGLAGFSMSSAIGRIGLFGGASDAKIDVRGPARDQESNSFFAGAYLHGAFHGLRLHGALLAGQSRYRSTWEHANNLAPGGRERVQVDYKSLFVSPQIGLSGEFNLNGLRLQPAVQLRYLGRFTRDHAYQPVSNSAPALFRIKKHNVHIGLLRAELRLPANLWTDGRSTLDGELRFGGEGRMVLSGRKIPGQLAGGDVSFKVGKKKSAMGFVGAGLRYNVSRLHLTLSADIEGSYDTDSATSVWGQVGFEWAF